MVLIFLGGLSYLLDTYYLYAASAMAANCIRKHSHLLLWKSAIVDRLSNPSHHVCIFFLSLALQFDRLSPVLSRNSLLRSSSLWVSLLVWSFFLFCFLSCLVLIFSCADPAIELLSFHLTLFSCSPTQHTMTFVAGLSVLCLPMPFLFYVGVSPPSSNLSLPI